MLDVDKLTEDEYVVLYLALHRSYIAHELKKMEGTRKQSVGNVVAHLRVKAAEKTVGQQRRKEVLYNLFTQMGAE